MSLDDFEKTERRWRKRQVFRRKEPRGDGRWVLAALMVGAVVLLVLAWPDLDHVLTSVWRDVWN